MFKLLKYEQIFIPQNGGNWNFIMNCRSRVNFTWIMTWLTSWLILIPEVPHKRLQSIPKSRLDLCTICQKVFHTPIYLSAQGMALGKCRSIRRLTRISSFYSCFKIIFFNNYVSSCVTASIIILLIQSRFTIQYIHDHIKIVFCDMEQPGLLLFNPLFCI